MGFPWWLVDADGTTVDLLPASRTESGVDYPGPKTRGRAGDVPGTAERRSRSPNTQRKGASDILPPQSENPAQQDAELQSQPQQSKSSPARQSRAEGVSFRARESSVDAIIQPRCRSSRSTCSVDGTRSKAMGVGDAGKEEEDGEYQEEENLDLDDPCCVDQMVQTTFPSERTNRQAMRLMYRKFLMIRRRCKTESKWKSLCFII